MRDKYRPNPITAAIRERYGTVSAFCRKLGLPEATTRKVIEGKHTGALIGSDSHKVAQALKRRGILRAAAIAGQARNDGKATYVG